jgi:polar amino acid transport system permease protein
VVRPLGGNEVRLETLINAFLNLGILRETAPFLWAGFKMSVLLTVVVVPLGVAGGLAVALLSRTPLLVVRWFVVGYVDLFRAFPPLVLLMFIAFGLPFTGLELPAFASVALAFLLNTSSYYGEIFRAGIESIPRGQFEAARSTGLSGAQTMAWVIVPQATRNVIPDLISNTLEVVKLTSIASVVALPELLFAARQAQSVTYNATPIIAAGIIYLVCLWPLVRLLSRFEHRQIALH